MVKNMGYEMFESVLEHVEDINVKSVLYVGSYYITRYNLQNVIKIYEVAFLFDYMQLCADNKQIIIFLVNIIRFYNFSFTMTTNTLKRHIITRDLLQK
jgi:hypothetical protein